MAKKARHVTNGSFVVNDVDPNRSTKKATIRMKSRCLACETINTHKRHVKINKGAVVRWKLEAMCAKCSQPFFFVGGKKY